ncbi:hypothetical protein CEUSTIGMA_g5932.t1 [Chlamydomonas eustigma]|uniref:Tyrosine-protein kinase ephrin type A/B receptor-like domain-containing protein n=1 Tax=Chlamydomonas eustigma TaxID=1157962 RepID=A0A250X5Y5_9CHLO|nr:hypothetical protein CEUSTIGMA_g5932.t1 [Chlamydomonas eustigma]|eukprot:GAX78493.1 hypothetical protein CEUSTIGMA_g5932.t1 [Chlamydomonas eustigma]
MTFLKRYYVQHLCTLLTVITLVDPSPCNPGFYVLKGECEGCPAGFSCLGGMSEPDPCGPGNFSAPLATNCSIANDGFYSPGTTKHHNATQQYPCPSGFECKADRSSAPPRGCSDPKPCPAGTWSPLHVAECLLCQGGTYCPGTSKHYNATEALECPAGFWCTQQDGNGTIKGCSKPLPCAPGTYSGPASEACLICSDGFWSPGTDSKRNATEALECPPGYSCIRNDPATGQATGCARPHPCGPNQYSEKCAMYCSKCGPGTSSPGTSPGHPSTSCTPDAISLIGPGSEGIVAADS